MSDTASNPSAHPDTASSAADWKRWQASLSMADWWLKTEAKDWLRANELFVRSLPNGTVIAVKIADDVVNGAAEMACHFVDVHRDWDYVTAPNGLAAMDKFEERFGQKAIAWVYDVGVPISLGGGSWALSSGA